MLKGISGIQDNINKSHNIPLWPNYWVRMKLPKNHLKGEKFLTKQEKSEIRLHKWPTGEPEKHQNPNPKL